MQAVETAKSLVAICEACPHAPIANARMLDKFIDELEKVQKRHPDYKRLVKGLSEYADHLQKHSTPVTFEQARGGIIPKAKLSAGLIMCISLDQTNRDINRRNVWRHNLLSSGNRP